MTCDRPWSGLLGCAHKSYWAVPTRVKQRKLMSERINNIFYQDTRESREAEQRHRPHPEMGGGGCGDTAARSGSFVFF